ncbi:uncharacterized protein LOC121019435 isoform X5 [Herpailurus yagouaroundi]|uniref:uncharacterized protein LOC121019435 isoform X5 n=1 Tax=Herpailurus yagouaroundi TaxID=1608482 RepID=UPI001AD76116|nr:uncharacterized protein LOC121019435 isoform X5 [Puma yagouaroundi]
MQTLQKKYPFVNRRKLGLKEREQVGGEKQLSAAEETLKLAAEELWNYKACELEKVMAEQSREVAYLKCRLEVIHKQRLPEESRKHKPMAAGPDRKIPPWREPLANPEAGVAPVSQNKHFTKNAEKDKGSVDPWGPPLLTGRFCTPYPRGPPHGL